MKRWAIPALLILQALLFFRYPLFVPGYAIPWDLRSLHLPHAYLYSDALAEGHLPLWDPYTYCGRPELANTQAATLYPAMPVVAALGLAFGRDTLLNWLCWNVALHVALAGLFAWLLARALGLGAPAAYFGATAYQLCGFFAAHAEHMGAVMVAAWLPGALWCVYRWRLRPSLRPVLLAGASFALMVLAGLTPEAAACVAGCFAFALLLFLFDGARWQVLAMVAVASAGGALLSAAQWAPTVQLTNLSVAQFRYEWLGNGGGVSWRALVSLVLPNYYHIFQPALYRQPEDLSFVYLYCGVLGIAFAVCGVVLACCGTRGSREGRPQNATACPTKLCRVFSALAVLGALAMLGDTTPVGLAVLRATPLKIRIALHPELSAPILCIALAMLAALAFDRLAKRPALAWTLAVIAAIDLIAVSSNRPMNAVRLADEPGVTRDAFGGRREPVTVLRRLTGTAVPPSRIDTIDDAADWASSAPTTHLYTANGEDVMAVYRLMQARLAFCHGQRWGAYYQVSDLRSPVLGLMNIGYLLTREPVSDAQLAGSPFRAAGSVPGSLIYQNQAVLPRFFLATRLRPARDMQEATALMKSADFDAAHEAIVEGGAVIPATGGDAVAHITVAEYGMESVALDIETDRAAYLVTSETYYPGWRAWLDGQPREIYYTNVAFRGLPIPAGRHRVTMSFEPGLVRGALAVSVVAWLVWLGLLWATSVGGHRRYDRSVAR